jgi:hypothetical protein
MFSKFLFLGAASQVIQLGDFGIDLWWWPFVFAFFKNVFILLDILILVAIIMLAYRYRIFGLRVYEAIEEAMASGKLSRDRTQRKWGEIEEFMKSERISDKKKAVIMAERILDNALKTSNFAGENLEKRLAKIPEGNLNFHDDIIWAYKFKESLESDNTFNPDEEEIKRAFYIFERSLKEMNIL